MNLLLGNNKETQGGKNLTKVHPFLKKENLIFTTSGDADPNLKF